jgi:hypothetical protein
MAHCTACLAAHSAPRRNQVSVAGGKQGPGALLCRLTCGFLTLACLSQQGHFLYGNCSVSLPVLLQVQEHVCAFDKRHDGHSLS